MMFARRKGFSIKSLLGFCLVIDSGILLLMGKPWAALVALVVGVVFLALYLMFEPL